MNNLLNRFGSSFLLGIGTILVCSSPTTALAQNTPADTLTFSNTQTWSPRYLDMAKAAIDIPDITLPAPPANTSPETAQELAIMHAYQDARTDRSLEEITQEISIYDALFGKQTFGQLVDEKTRPLTFALMIEVIELESPQIMKQKKIYDRVRPSLLDPSLIPAIAIPLHPAYPSGHSTQAHLRAHVLSELDPAHRDVYFQSAKRIAHNREVAGLHYPSDSRAGAQLAKQLFANLMKNRRFSQRLKKAKAEWP
ncbi:MAG: phosphatase PAP2 family protein [Arenimonas sp.]